MVFFWEASPRLVVVGEGFCGRSARGSIQHVPCVPQHDIPSLPDAPQTRFAASPLPLALLSAAHGQGSGRESQGSVMYWGAHAVLLLPSSRVLHENGEGKKQEGRAASLWSPGPHGNVSLGVSTTEAARYCSPFGSPSTRCCQGWLREPPGQQRCSEQDAALRDGQERAGAERKGEKGSRESRHWGRRGSALYLNPVRSFVS